MRGRKALEAARHSAHPEPWGPHGHRLRTPPETPGNPRKPLRQPANLLWLQRDPATCVMRPLFLPVLSDQRPPELHRTPASRDRHPTPGQTHVGAKQGGMVSGCVSGGSRWPCRLVKAGLPHGHQPKTAADHATHATCVRPASHPRSGRDRLKLSPSPGAALIRGVSQALRTGFGRGGGRGGWDGIQWRFSHSVAELAEKRLDLSALDAMLRNPQRCAVQV